MLCPIGTAERKSLERAWITRSEITGVRAATKLQMGKFGESAFRCAFFGVSEFSLVESLLLRSCFSGSEPTRLAANNRPESLRSVYICIS